MIGTPEEQGLAETEDDWPGRLADESEAEGLDGWVGLEGMAFQVREHGR
ncbi:hypothetical protein ACIQOW_06405 [Kitasatospora sp. NPDC091335]